MPNHPHTPHPVRTVLSAARLCALLALSALPLAGVQAQHAAPTSTNTQLPTPAHTTPAPASTVATVPTGGALALHQPLPALQLNDQHDQAWRVPGHTRLVLFAAGRKASNLVQAVLAHETADFLARHHTVYLADLSKMPSMATRMFALPSLRAMPFTVGVSLNEATLTGWPRQPDSVTLIHLANGMVHTVTYATTEADVRAALPR